MAMIAPAVLTATLVFASVWAYNKDRLKLGDRLLKGAIFFFVVTDIVFILSINN